MFVFGEPNIVFLNSSIDWEKITGKRMIREQDLYGVLESFKLWFFHFIYPFYLHFIIYFFKNKADFQVVCFFNCNSKDFQMIISTQSMVVVFRIYIWDVSFAW